jgi:hypothetical protein
MQILGRRVIFWGRRGNPLNDTPFFPGVCLNSFANLLSEGDARLVCACE